MKANFEDAMAMLGTKMGIATTAETVHCLVAFVGIAIAVAFCIVF